jgi:hypothetical protein
MLRELENMDMIAVEGTLLGRGKQASTAVDVLDSFLDGSQDERSYGMHGWDAHKRERIMKRSTCL